MGQLRLRREVVIPVPSYRRPSSLLGVGLALVLMASAVDAVVWTYQARQQARWGDAADARRFHAVRHHRSEAPLELDVAATIAERGRCTGGLEP